MATLVNSRASGVAEAVSNCLSITATTTSDNTSTGTLPQVYISDPWQSTVTYTYYSPVSPPEPPKMNYMPIVPIGMFDVLDLSGLKNVFLLSQFWDTKEYRQYYSSRTWDTVIIDNALYEDDVAVEFQDVLDIARQIHANKIYAVGPEDLKSGIRTAQLCLKALKEVPSYDLPHNTQMMVILHEKPNEMKLQYKVLQQASRPLALGVSIFSYRLGYNRGDLARFVGIDRSKYYMHAFGWDNILELYALNGTGFRSVDSSLAVTAAINGIELKDDWQVTRDPGKAGVKASTRAKITDEDFSDEVKTVALDNILFLQECCQSMR